MLECVPNRKKKKQTEQKPTEHALFNGFHIFIMIAVANRIEIIINK